MGMSRDKSGLAVISSEPPKPGCSPDEVQARREKATRARQAAHNEAYGPDTTDPIFSDWKIASQEDAKRLWSEMVKGIKAGDGYRVRVQKV
jgi:hypothetical protein